MSLRDNPNIIEEVSDLRRDLDELASNMENGGLVTTDMIDDGAVTSAKIDYSTMVADSNVADGLGWVYLGQAKTTSETNVVTFTLPAQYNNYKVTFEAEMASNASANTWIDLRPMNGSNDITGGYQVQDVSGTTWSSGTYTGSFAVNGTASAYDAVNIEWTSYCQRPGVNYRKNQGFFFRAGGTYQTRIHNGRFNSATSPTGFRVISGSNFQINATMKVWGSNI